VETPRNPKKNYNFKWRKIVAINGKIKGTRIQGQEVAKRRATLKTIGGFPSRPSHQLGTFAWNVVGIQYDIVGLDVGLVSKFSLFSVTYLEALVVCVDYCYLGSST
jgi:hypothetical protein